MTTEAVVRRRGRPRNTAVDETILDAAIGLLVEVGFEGFSMDVVASRAGVGKATIYRRWPNREGLVIHALARRTDPFEDVPEGTARDRLVAVLRNVLRHAQSPIGRLLPCMVGATVSNPLLASHYRTQIIDPRRARVEEIILDGINAGELRGDIDIALTVDQVVGPLVYRLMFDRDSMQERYCDYIVDAVLAGIAQRA